jgi:hypothetical protein
MPSTELLEISNSIQSGFTWEAVPIVDAWRHREGLGYTGRITVVNPDAPGIIRSRAIVVLGQTEAGAATDHAIVKANEGISVVEVDNGSFATYTALLAALKVWNGAKAN